MQVLAQARLRLGRRRARAEGVNQRHKILVSIVHSSRLRLECTLCLSGYNLPMQFYSVKQRRMVEVPREHVRAHKYEHITKSGKRQVRYALQADYEGQRLTRFVDEATYLEYLPDDESERRWDELFSGSQDLLAQMAEKALQQYHAGRTTPRGEV
jgi:hypothetical protein